MEELRRDILVNMRDSLTSEQLSKLETTLDLCFYDYEMTKKSREITIHESPNELILKNFLGTKIVAGASENTIKLYRLMLDRMLKDIGKNATEITTNEIRYHLAKWQVERGVSVTTLSNMRSIYNSFFSWMELEEYISKNPVKKISAYKIPKHTVKPYTEQELTRLFEACEAVRDRALLEFLYSTGARVSECADLDINDVDILKGEILIKKGKGNKERIAFLSEVASYWLQKYLNTRKDNNKALWIGRQGRLTKNGIEAVVRTIGAKAGVENARPHRFRHTLATNLIKRGAPAPIVQETLGHEKLNTTMGYVEIQKGESKHVHSKLIA